VTTQPRKAATARWPPSRGRRWAGPRPANRRPSAACGSGRGRAEALPGSGKGCLGCPSSPPPGPEHLCLDLQVLAGDLLRHRSTRRPILGLPRWRPGWPVVAGRSRFRRRRGAAALGAQQGPDLLGRNLEQRGQLVRTAAELVENGQHDRLPRVDVREQGLARTAGGHNPPSGYPRRRNCPHASC
jgi:hypothetical protein